MTNSLERLLQGILRVTLNKDLAGTNDNLIFLPDIAVDGNQEAINDNQILDVVFVARLSVAGTAGIVYLVECWQRSTKFQFSDPQTKIRIQSLIASYIGTLLQYPGMFLEENGSDFDTISALADADDDRFPYDLLVQIAVVHQESGALADVMTPIIVALSDKLRTLSLTQDFGRYIRIVGKLVSIKPIAEILVEWPSFNPSSLPARAFEVASLLGPLFRLSSFGCDDLELAVGHFGQPHQRNRTNVEAAFHSLRLALDTLQQGLYEIVLTLIKTSPAARGKVLDFFASILKQNENRGKMHIQDPTSVSTEGFMCNALAVLLKLCDPLMDPSFSKLHLIDLDYLKSSKRIPGVENWTKLNAQHGKEKEYYSNSSTKEFNFVTEIFYITITFRHFSIDRTVQTYLDLMKEINEHQKSLERVKSDRTRWNTAPQMMEALVKRLDGHIEKLKAIKLSFDIQLLHPAYLSHLLRFDHLSMRFLQRTMSLPTVIEESPNTASNLNEYGKGPLFRLPVALPLSKAPPESFKYYPEFFLEDICEFFLHLIRFTPQIFDSSQSGLVDEVVSFAVALLLCRASSTNPDFVKNPYLISKWVEVLFSLTWDFGDGTFVQQTLQNPFGNNPQVMNYLARGLLSFYVEVEKTGSSSQFYDKFGIRHNIAQVLKLLWKKYPAVYREKVKQTSVENWDMFLKFVNLLMNDTTYLLDESVTQLMEIHGIQVEMSDTDTWTQLPNNQREDKEKRLAELERRVQSYIQLGNETVNMLQYLTTSVIDPFLRPEIIDRLAAMLNYNLVQLVGPKHRDLKVKTPEKYGFKPRQLLSDILDIYIHLCPSNRNEFVASVVRDGRSYSSGHFLKAVEILKTHRIKRPDEIDILANLIQRFENVLAKDKIEEEEMGEAPEWCLDPLMFTVMDDPVILPSSKQIVDRSTITSHLLSDSTDPFNRAPLSIDMVEEATDLKRKIAEWRQSRKRIRD